MPSFGANNIRCDGFNGSTSLLFDGTSDYISTCDSSDWVISNQFTWTSNFTPPTEKLILTQSQKLKMAGKL